MILVTANGHVHVHVYIYIYIYTVYEYKARVGIWENYVYLCIYCIKIFIQYIHKHKDTYVYIV